MLFDLPTLLALRVGVDLLIALAFWAQMRRYPAIGGPGWWSLSAVLGILGSVMLWSRGALPDAVTFPVGNTALMVSALCAWLGFRSYIGASRPLLPILTAGLAFFCVTLFFLVEWDVLAVRQGVFTASIIAIAACSYLEIRRADPLRRVPEMQALKLLTAIELCGMVGFAVTLQVLGLSQEAMTPPFVFFFLLTKLLRVVLYGALVSYRLRLDGDKARQGLQQREADSHALIDNLSAGVMVFRPDHTLSSINTAARRFLSWSEGGANPALPEPSVEGWQMLREDGQPMRRHEMPFERVLATGQPVRSVVIGMPQGAGEVHWALCNAYPENNAQGGLRHVVLTFIDVTSLKNAQAQQKHLQAQLAQSQKMEALGTLAGGVAHDFNNILAAILGNADLARQDLPPEAASRESLHEISTAARRGRELVRQILAFSRQQPVERTRVNVCTVLAESCTLLRGALPPQVELVQSCAPNTLSIEADATQIGQVLVNLCTNAIHALDGRPGRIECRIDGLANTSSLLPAELAQTCAQLGVGAVRLRVSDNGCGMLEAVRNRIFEPFFTTKAVGRGTGLGLPVVLGIVQVHGGAIEVDTEPGKGTMFTLFFPAAPDELAWDGEETTAMLSREPGTMGFSPSLSPAVPSPTPDHAMADDLSTDSPHILYLDDDDTLVFLVRRLLERRGYRVTAYTSQTQAIDAVRAAPTGFQLLLTDFNMPGMSGLEVAKAVLEINPRMPVAVASGYITDELQAEAKAAGVREVVFKTDAVEAFCEVVARLVRSEPV
ncbi:ATP-binding protein [Hydrogenophaga sp.]|uniref:hybrid sensor histidine kinase/response regulator n=1 Tax=Hydrogenophaga sp. TaxID=1904254 RepID=UPI002731E7EA|nr:ATP-binding protein [Hydrogenophaga sp.]MDP2016138.1 ATP-binding protein [Hydrogenophaga sp.]MDP3164821.1 ATP-binding protein [Hydrogenophaga sp.]MDP3813355.1 ATP-binding protein [Hydrogenophaga sp.]